MKGSLNLRTMTTCSVTCIIFSLFLVTDVWSSLCIKNTENKGKHVFICVQGGGTPCGKGSGIGHCTWGNPIEVYVPANKKKCVRPTENQGGSGRCKYEVRTYWAGSCPEKGWVRVYGNTHQSDNPLILYKKGGDWLIKRQ